MELRTYKAVQYSVLYLPYLTLTYLGVLGYLDLPGELCM